MGSGIRNVSNPDGGSSLVNLRVALLEVTLKPSAKFSFFDSRFFRNGSMLIEQISATSITCDPWLLLNPWMWGKNHTTCIMYLCMCIYISVCNFLMESFIVDISRWFKNTWCKRRISCDTMVVKHSKATINHPYFDGLSVYPTISHLFVVQLKMVCYCFTNIELPSGYLT